MEKINVAELLENCPIGIPAFSVNDVFDYLDLIQRVLRCNRIELNIKN